MKRICCGILAAILFIGGVLTQVAWLGVCFGTVVIGILLLFLAPGILFFPFLFGVSAAGTALTIGFEESNTPVDSDDYIDDDYSR